MIEWDIGFWYNLTDPYSKRAKLGVLRLNGDTFVSFDWTADRAALNVGEMTNDLFDMLPVLLAGVVADKPADQPMYEHLVLSLQHGNVHVMGAQR